MSRILMIGLLASLLGIVPTPPAQKARPPKYVTNSIGMKFVWIPPGSFVMGSPKKEPLRPQYDDEKQHYVTLTKGFYMGIYPVTQEQWQAIMGSNPSYFQGKNNPNLEKNLPVESVCWDDCQKFLSKLREKEKKRYRLPSEAEWEYACRAGTTTIFHFGDKISTDQANFLAENACALSEIGVSRIRTSPVDSFPPNKWGVYDMHGNVAQWCQDWYVLDLGQKDVIDPQGPAKGTSRIVRGGCWGAHAGFARAACRGAGEPNPNGHTNNLGFRVCFFPE